VTNYLESCGLFYEINKKNDEEREEFAKISEENFNQLREKMNKKQQNYP
jgi:glutamate formiminotransferase